MILNFPTLRYKFVVRELLLNARTTVCNISRARIPEQNRGAPELVAVNDLGQRLCDTIPAFSLKSSGNRSSLILQLEHDGKNDTVSHSHQNNVLWKMILQS
ncbi:predicted protein [Aspergillus nidulans FGSC A4]|uniref:Uncharacterized protein n=1 Tax=Emericella nidulans (strain FGSC A4 / ATCC 38163 / CBS 112.46 / NRRL 194 / M139) TaxID=227321 RepID=Q5ASK5_EMENI|nr:hypothetical protein [Aspergillus nidulans FGSC A4]EAA60274.1 predicted protein [Aspergillus nidulans FGSC A4]CBF78157.1 TPA: conserved hypothetical protein [Aspergillus nidulans FGSC A4]|eukprot:XP_681994.1 predicted protein [Aspergillus nidulans FGSC A4]